MPSKPDKPFPENILHKYGPSVAYLFVLTLLLEDLLGLGMFLSIRWQHVVLIGGLLLIPFLREVDQFFIPNVGGFQMRRTQEWKETMQEVLDEAGFERHERKKDVSNGDAVQSKEEEEEEERDAGESKKEPVGSGEVETLGGNVDKIATNIYQLANSNPRMAISQLGMELEHGLRHLIHAKGKTPRLQYHEMLNQLEEDPEIDSRFLSIAREIRYARNEAVHSAEFKTRDMAGLIDVGIDLLRYINQATESEKIPEREPPSPSNS